MYTIISGTNRPDNVSQHIAKFYQELLTNREISSKILYLDQLPVDFVFNNEVMGTANSGLTDLIETYISSAKKFIFILPEYNGSYPGVLKAFVDAVHPKHFLNKKASLIGISAGRSGNLRGMDQFTNVLNYLTIAVLPVKPLLPNVTALLDINMHVKDVETTTFLNEQITLFESF